MMKNKPPARKIEYELFGGGFTSSLTKHIKSYKDAARPLERLTGLVLSGFGAGFVFDEIVTKSNGKKVLVKSHPISEDLITRISAGWENGGVYPKGE